MPVDVLNCSLLWWMKEGLLVVLSLFYWQRLMQKTVNNAQGRVLLSALHWGSLHHLHSYKNRALSKYDTNIDFTQKYIHYIMQQLYILHKTFFTMCTNRKRQKCCCFSSFWGLQSIWGQWKPSVPLSPAPKALESSDSLRTEHWVQSVTLRHHIVTEVCSETEEKCLSQNDEQIKQSEYFPQSSLLQSRTPDPPQTPTRSDLSPVWYSPNRVQATLQLQAVMSSRTPRAAAQTFKPSRDSVTYLESNKAPPMLAH